MKTALRVILISSNHCLSKRTEREREGETEITWGERKRRRVEEREEERQREEREDGREREGGRERKRERGGGRE